MVVVGASVMTGSQSLESTHQERKFGHAKGLDRYPGVHIHGFRKD